MLLYQTLAYTLNGEILEKMEKWRKSYKNNAFRMLAQTRNEEFQVLGGLYSVSDIQDYFQYILKNMEKRLIILQ